MGLVDLLWALGALAALAVYLYLALRLSRKKGLFYMLDKLGRGL